MQFPDLFCAAWILPDWQSKRCWLKSWIHHLCEIFLVCDAIIKWCHVLAYNMYHQLGCSRCPGSSRLKLTRSYLRSWSMPRFKEHICSTWTPWTPMLEHSCDKEPVKDSVSRDRFSCWSFIPGSGSTMSHGSSSSDSCRAMIRHKEEKSKREREKEKGKKVLRVTVKQRRKRKEWEWEKRELLMGDDALACYYYISYHNLFRVLGCMGNCSLSRCSIKARNKVLYFNEA